MNFSIFPRTVYKARSEISGEIVVQEQLGLHTLYVQNLIQSGGIVKGIWKKSFYQVQDVSKCLMLGLGGGTVVQLIKARWPQAKIVGVEIDPEIIEIGKKYFGLGGVPGLQIVNADAFEYVGRTKEKFDLIIIDLYLGKKFPAQAANNDFLKKIKSLLLPEGVAIFNRLRTGMVLGNFEKKLETHFSQVNLAKTPTNLFFLARNARI